MKTELAYFCGTLTKHFHLLPCLTFKIVLEKEIRRRLLLFLRWTS